MRKLHTRKGGFTLIELMIVVAIIGILAAIAIPNFLMFQLRAKTGEAKTNLAGIRTAQEGYFAEFGSYVVALASPTAMPNPRSQKNPWLPDPGYVTLGWAPEGEVFYQYDVAVLNSAYSAAAQGDLDAAGTTSEFAYIHPDGAGVTVAPAFGCSTTGVWRPGSSPAVYDLFNTVGGCTENEGQSEF